MEITNKEHYEIMDMFEKEYKGKRLDKEDKSLWKHHIYQDGLVNELFFAYRRGYALGKSS